MEVFVETVARLKNVLTRIDSGLSTQDNDSSLLDSGIIDSLSILKLVNEIEEEFNIEIDENDLEIENFETLNKIAELIERQK
ncbi:phosphopantetheine-binding protein [Candidatus Riflebacteria bacterium]